MRTRDTSIFTKLDGEKKYKWNVTFQSASAVKYATASPDFTFLIKGPQLPMPKLTIGDTQALSSLSWTESLGAQSYSLVIRRRAIDETEWTVFKQEKMKTLFWEFGLLTPGAYRFEVTAESDVRSSSDTDTREIMIKPTKQQVLDNLRAIKK